ncbi:MOSC domain containing protein [Hymenobacter roseosalivarius DSM 11622]|uniref:MOSC domain containing protein n=1 Tax=Hymenobacter roseosalivarius DSM 11622 TaxID=645990 RepID=A0A1W1W0K8_9BACT|nr:MOSC domain-containing protein [Hymenobacter roseosalivarius]SMB99172.1 MOSC domain containing protein [Hymenobacter roseosalivarius DSM 11622]
MRLLSVNTGLPQEISWQDKLVRTSIFKQPVAEPVYVHAEHLAGDGQADLRVHGGPNKAVYAYPHEHYAFWQDFLPPSRLVIGAFGENLTTIGLLENQVRVGDCYQIGTAVLMAIQPRQPCFKLGIRLQDESIVRRFEQSRRSGIYFRVQQEGILQVGDAITLVQPSASAVTIQDMIDSNAPGPKNPHKIREILELPHLSPSWRERLSQLIAAGN